MNDREINERKIEMISARLVETGQGDKLREFLEQKLYECGWRSELKNYFKEIVKQKGLENVTVDDLVNDALPKGKSLVPDSIKKELLQRVRNFIAQQNDL